MPISRYDIVVATHPKELNALMADGGYVAIKAAIDALQKAPQ